MKLPSEFEARTLEWMGEETYRALEAALQTEPPVSIRVNRTKWSGEVTGEPVLWASAGVYLSQRPILHSIRCFMLVAIMCKKRLPCLWNRYYALILPGLW